MKRVVTLICFLCLISITFAQYNVSPEYCATSRKMQKLRNDLSTHDRALYDLQRETYKQELQQYIQAHHDELFTQDNQKTITYTIPVVFHIIHKGGSENISKEQILNVLQHVNEDFQMLNTDLSNTIPEFQNIIANIGIEFKLAKFDPNGNCTNGITRTFSPSTSTGIESDQVQAVINAHGVWPGDEYLNIFIAKYIGGAAGYTRKPFSSIYGGEDMSNGIFLLDIYTGTIGTGLPIAAHTLSHEVGHWLDLDHVWGGSNDPALPSNCQIDDGISDTPNCIGSTVGVCDLTRTTCNSNVDPVQNFMDYSYCSTMFTLGQKARMIAALSSSVGGRNNVVSAANLAATGVNLPGAPCKAIFDANYRVVCQGQPVTFEDLSYFNISDWNWEFQGATPSISQNQNPTIVYNQSGIFPVKLTVSDGSSSVSTTKQAYIKVLPSSVSTPFVEGFENITNLDNSDWIVENPGANNQFEITSNAAYMGSKSIVLKNFGQPEGGEDAIMSSPIDLSTANTTEGVTLTFRYAHRVRANNQKDILQVLFSNDCGEYWSVRKILAGTNFNGKIASNSWTPSSNTDWTTVHITNFSQSYFIDNFRVKFKFISDNGNNLYIDNINIYKGNPSQLAIIKNEQIKGLSIFPNPTTSTTTVSFVLDKEAAVKINVVNITGKKVLTNVIQAKSGQNLVVVDTENLDAGVYLLQLNVGQTNQVKKLIIK